MVEAIKQSVREGLAKYLSDQLTPSFPELSVMQEWPAPGVGLPKQAISVLAAGTPHSEFHIPTLVRFDMIDNDVGSAVYTYAWIEQPMQLDVWATSQADRDALSLALELALNRPSSESLGIQALPQFRRRRGVTVSGQTYLSGLYGCPVNYWFEAESQLQDDADSAASGEWRATWTGRADTYAVDAQQAAILKKVILQFNGENA